MGPTADDLGDYERPKVYDDQDCRPDNRSANSGPTYPSGWRYTFHYEELTAGPETLDDWTIRRYDNAHEDTNCTPHRTRNR